jgi:hypothetical protein
MFQNSRQADLSRLGRFLMFSFDKLMQNHAICAESLP